MIDLTSTLFIHSNASILSALEQMNDSKRKMLIVLDENNKFLSVFSIGDVQRAIIHKLPFESSISQILRKEITVCYQRQSLDEIKDLMLEKRTECMPVLDDMNNLVNVYFWEDVFGNAIKRKNVNLNLPVVIMAGGKGSRLKPLTNVIPKPLLPINEKTILEDIMDKFIEVGCHIFYLSVNYKADLIKYHFASLNNTHYDIHYFEEEKPLGTAGSMFLIKDEIQSTFFVTNCDILIDQDLEEIYNYHQENKNDITVVSAVKKYKIPYGTIQTADEGMLLSLDEKPELIFQINTGMYVLEPDILELIPKNTFFHITHLIDKAIANSKRVGVFPISESSWMDIGSWEEYKNILNHKQINI